MSAAYPASPTDVPASLTQASTNYRRHAWLAVGGLMLFVIAYFALAGWFGWTAWRLLSGYASTGSENIIPSLFAGACSAFLAVFMLKALVFIKHGGTVDDLEVTAAEQPALFEFLHRLAAETGAPRPHRVYLSGARERSRLLRSLHREPAPALRARISRSASGWSTCSRSAS